MHDQKAQGTPRRSIPRRAIAATILAALGIGLAFAASAAFIAAKTKDVRFIDIARVPAEPVAMVFGAGVERD